ncbi:MAG: hypothetical protein ACI841_000265 [Planctomycetota bacterium]|jgi:hypothetical protein
MHSLATLVVSTTIATALSVGVHHALQGKGLLASSDRSAKRALRAGQFDRPSDLMDWHKSLDDAQRASALSGKPVLVFQLLGRLDEELC